VVEKRGPAHPHVEIDNSRDPRENDEKEQEEKEKGDMDSSSMNIMIVVGTTPFCFVYLPC